MILILKSSLLPVAVFFKKNIVKPINLMVKLNFAIQMENHTILPFKKSIRIKFAIDARISSASIIQRCDLFNHDASISNASILPTSTLSASIQSIGIVP